MCMYLFYHLLHSQVISHTFVQETEVHCFGGTPCTCKPADHKWKCFFICSEQSLLRQCSSPFAVTAWQYGAQGNANPESGKGAIQWTIVKHTTNTKLTISERLFLPFWLQDVGCCAFIQNLLFLYFL